jgi:hypothetical protein
LKGDMNASMVHRAIQPAAATSFLDSWPSGIFVADVGGWIPTRRTHRLQPSSSSYKRVCQLLQIRAVVAIVNDVLRLGILRPNARLRPVPPFSLLALGLGGKSAVASGKHNIRLRTRGWRRGDMARLPRIYSRAPALCPLLHR